MVLLNTRCRRWVVVNVIVVSVAVRIFIVCWRFRLRTMKVPLVLLVRPSRVNGTTVSVRTSGRTMRCRLLLMCDLLLWVMRPLVARSYSTLKIVILKTRRCELLCVVCLVLITLTRVRVIVLKTRILLALCRGLLRTTLMTLAASWNAIEPCYLPSLTGDVATLTWSTHSRTSSVAWLPWDGI